MCGPSVYKNAEIRMAGRGIPKIGSQGQATVFDEISCPITLPISTFHWSDAPGPLARQITHFVCAPHAIFPAHNGINQTAISSSWAQKECQTGEDGVKNRDIFRIHIALPQRKQHLENAPQ